jgi:flagellar hook-associated protein 1 FlgK
MGNFTTKILTNSISAMGAQQALIANVSNNIANVNTPGYTRKQVELRAREAGNGDPSSLQVGNGVEVGTVQRIADQYLDKLLREATSTQGTATVRNEYLARIEAVFSLSTNQLTIGKAVGEFFSAINQVSLSPSNIDLRSNLIQKGADLVTSIKTAFGEVASLQEELDNRLTTEVPIINDLTGKIAQLNGLISARERGGTPAVDERDQRDTLLGKLSDKISYSMVEDVSGSVSIFLDNGFPLVNESTHRELKTTITPSFAPDDLPPSLSGKILHHVVYNYGSDSSPSHLDLTQVLKNGGGSVGGILQLRGYNDPSSTSAYQADGELVAIAARIEALTRGLLLDVNRTYLGPDEDPGSAGHQPSSGDLNGATPPVFGLFDFTFNGTKDVNGNGLPDLSDLTSPTIGIDSFSKVLTFRITDPRDFAAARDSNATTGATSFAPGDGSNAQAISSMRSSNVNFGAGNFSYTGTFDELYNSTVAFVGSAKGTAQQTLNIAKANYTTAANKRDETSAVNLDEEFANLIRYQRAFQASARLIQTASDLLEKIVNIL